MLLKVLPDDAPKNMHITDFPQMSLFQTSINLNSSTSDPKEITVTYQTPKAPLVPFHADQSRSLRIPLNPKFQGLERIDVTMHESTTSAYKMPDEFNSWFSNCFGFPVVLAYLGDGLRQALGNISPNYSTKAPSAKGKSAWLSGLSSYIPLPGQFQGIWKDEGVVDDGITFADCAAFLGEILCSLSFILPIKGAEILSEEYIRSIKKYILLSNLESTAPNPLLG